MTEKDKYNYITSFIRTVRTGTKGGFIKWVEMPSEVVEIVRNAVIDKIENAYIEKNYKDGETSVFLLKTNQTGNYRYRFGFYQNSDKKVIQAPYELLIDDSRVSELVALYQVVEITVYKQKMLELNEQLELYKKSLGNLLKNIDSKKE